MSEFIERSDAEKAIREYADVKHNNGDITTANCVLKAVSVLKEIPAADVVEVVHSKWIKTNNERRCPICHFFYLTNGTTVYNLCPMCGAKMDGKE